MRQSIIAAFCACSVLGAHASADEVALTNEAPAAQSAATTPEAATIADDEAEHREAAPPPAPQASAVVTPTELSDDDLYVLRRKEIGAFPYVVGGFASVYPGFGLGHVIQGRFGQKGRLFMTGELLGAGVLFAELVRTAMGCDAGCDLGPLFYLGVGTFGVFKVWEVVDAWAYPPRHNERYHELKQRRATGMTLTMPKPRVLPSAAFAMPESAPPLQFAIGF